MCLSRTPSVQRIGWTPTRRRGRRMSDKGSDLPVRARTGALLVTTIVGGHVAWPVDVCRFSGSCLVLWAREKQRNCFAEDLPANRWAWPHLERWSWAVSTAGLAGIAWGGGLQFWTAPGWFMLSSGSTTPAAYFAGRAFGRHKLAPSICPGKTWEGWAGGMVASVAGGPGSSMRLCRFPRLGGPWPWSCPYWAPWVT